MRNIYACVYIKFINVYNRGAARDPQGEISTHDCSGGAVVVRVSILKKKSLLYSVVKLIGWGLWLSGFSLKILGVLASILKKSLIS